MYSWTDTFSDSGLQRSKHGSNCARSSEQQAKLALGLFLIAEIIVVRGDRKSRPKKQHINVFSASSKKERL